MFALGSPQAEVQQLPGWATAPGLASASNVDFDPNTVGVIDKDLRQRDLGPLRRTVRNTALVQHLAGRNEVSAFKSNVVEGTAIGETFVMIDEVQMHNRGVAQEQPCSGEAKVGAIIGAVLEPEDLFVERNGLVRLSCVDVDVIEPDDSHSAMLDHRQ